MSSIPAHRFAIAFFLVGCALLGASLGRIARHLDLLPGDLMAPAKGGALELEAPKARADAAEAAEGKAAAVPAPAPAPALAAKPPVDIFTLSRTPIAVVGRMRYQVLGLGQDETTGAQVVWLRSLGSNRISGFAEGAAIFGGPVRVERISASHVGFRHDDKVVRIALDVE
jgi:hypothetical protein